MKAVIGGIVLAVCLAAAAAFVLNSEVQRSTTDRFQTDAVRL